MWEDRVQSHSIGALEREDVTGWGLELEMQRVERFKILAGVEQNTGEPTEFRTETCHSSLTQTAGARLGSLFVLLLVLPFVFAYLTSRGF